MAPREALQCYFLALPPEAALGPGTSAQAPVMRGEQRRWGSNWQKGSEPRQLGGCQAPRGPPPPWPASSYHPPLRLPAAGPDRGEGQTGTAEGPDTGVRAEVQKESV